MLEGVEVSVDDGVIVGVGVGSGHDGSSVGPVCAESGGDVGIGVVIISGFGDDVTIGVGVGSGHDGSAVGPVCMGSAGAVGTGVAMITVIRGALRKSERQSSRQFCEMSGLRALIAM